MENNEIEGNPMFQIFQRSDEKVLGLQKTKPKI